MSTELAEKKTFEERMMDRIRDSVADLITDDELKKIIERGTEKALFEPRTVRGEWGRQETRKSFVEEAVEKFLHERIRIAVDEWIKANPERMHHAVESAIRGGIGNAVLFALENRFAPALLGLQDRLREHGMPC